MRIGLTLCFIFSTCLLFSQENKFDKISRLLDHSEADSGLVILKKIDTSRTSSYEKGLWCLYMSQAYFLKDENGECFRHAHRAKEHFLEADSIDWLAETNFLLLEAVASQKNLNYEEGPILSELTSYAEQKKDPLLSARVYSRIAGNFLYHSKGEEALHYYDRSISELKKIKDTLRIALIEGNKGAVHSTVTHKYDSALFYYKKSLPILKSKVNNQAVSFNYNNQAEVYKKMGDYAEALRYYNLANEIELKKNEASTQLIYYENLTELYEKMGNYKNAYAYSIKAKNLSDSINHTAQNIAISEIQTKYETEKKEKENLQLKTQVEKKSRAQKLLWGGLGLSLGIGALISLLIYKNEQKKQKLTQQEQQLQLQQVEKTLKEQELNTIDSMIAGQEKERQRLANDLHDNLGSTLATLKLNFKTLQKNIDTNENAPLLDNAMQLIDEAYKKTREIAHEKNSGVMANEGLLPAVKSMARKISTAKGVQVEVQDFGLEKRLDNIMEIAVFRIIQELTTNIVKHAGATEATISLTNHEDLLNIIVEDNGKGFNPQKAMKKDGMGLANIEKRVEHMEGSMEIDSSEKGGTSVIIDLPI